MTVLLQRERSEYSPTHFDTNKCDRITLLINKPFTKFLHIHVAFVTNP